MKQIPGVQVGSLTPKFFHKKTIGQLIEELKRYEKEAIMYWSDTGWQDKDPYFQFMKSEKENVK